MNRWLSMILVVSLFVSGAVVGALGMHLYWTRRIFGLEAPPFAGGGRFAEHMRKELNLTGAQVERIQEILRESREEARELRQTLEPQVRAAMERTASRIRDVLDDAQRRDFDELRRQHRRWVEPFLLGRGMGRGMGRGPHRPPFERPPHEPPPPPPDRSPSASPGSD